MFRGTKEVVLEKWMVEKAVVVVMLFGMMSVGNGGTSTDSVATSQLLAYQLPPPLLLLGFLFHKWKVRHPITIALTACHPPYFNNLSLFLLQLLLVCMYVMENGDYNFKSTAGMFLM